MALPSVDAVAFCRPGGESCGQTRARPVDLVHLSRQTMGDRAVEQQVLALFMHQAQVVRERIAASDEKGRFALAHGLRGAASGIGAFRIADIAAKVEADPGDETHLEALASAIDEVRDFISSINR